MAEGAAQTAWSGLRRSIMQASNGLCGVELDLAAATVSRANACHVQSLEADLHSSGQKRLPARVSALSGEGVEIDLCPRWRALIDYAAALSETPSAAGANELAALRLVGLSDLEILDATHAIALIAWIDRSWMPGGDIHQDN